MGLGTLLSSWLACACKIYKLASVFSLTAPSPLPTPPGSVSVPGGAQALQKQVPSWLNLVTAGNTGMGSLHRKGLGPQALFLQCASASRPGTRPAF